MARSSDWGKVRTTKPICTLNQIRLNATGTYDRLKLGDLPRSERSSLSCLVTRYGCGVVSKSQRGTERKGVGCLPEHLRVTGELSGQMTSPRSATMGACIRPSLATWYSVPLIEPRACHATLNRSRQ